MEPVYRFAPFELQPATRRLLRAGEPQKLSSRAFDLLMALVEHRERVVSKAELLQLVWPRLVVEENNLQVHVMALRKLLGPHAIATVPGRGYRFAAVLEAPSAARAPVVAGDAEVSLLGRGDDIGALCALVPAHALVTVLGAGGVGKSTLAARVASLCAPAFADGTVWVDFSSQSPALRVVEAIAAALRLALPAGDALQALGSALARARLLLVLDNAEHLADPLGRVVKALMQSAPGVHCLVTSQVPLRLRAEQLYRLEPLALPDPDADVREACASPAVQLFVARVRAVDRHFVLDGHNVQPVVVLTRRLDGLPLAIEMAAARVPALTPAQLASALDERFRLLTRGEPGAPSRQHTLLAAMEWAHGLLAPAERAVFRRLAVFAGTFSMQAAQQVCGDDRLDEWQVLDALSVLVDRALVAPPRGEPPRYRLLDTPRAYALQLLAASGEEAATRYRHLACVRDEMVALFEAHLWARRPATVREPEVMAQASNGLAALEWALANPPADVATLLIELAPGLAQALADRHAARLAVWRQTEPYASRCPSPAARARWQLGWAQFWNAIGQAGMRDAALEASVVFAREGHRAGEYRAQAIVASVLSGQVLTEAQSDALARMEALEDPAWPGDLRYLRQYVRITHLDALDRCDDALAVGEACAELVAGRGGRTLHDVVMMYLELRAGRAADAARRGECARERQPRRLAGHLASGVEILLLLARLQSGQRAGARELAGAVWAAASVFRYLGPAAEVMSLLAVQEQRPRTASLLLGFAETAYSAQPTQRLLVYQRAAEQAEALTAHQMAAADAAAWKKKGRLIEEESLRVLALSEQDARP